MPIAEAIDSEASSVRQWVVLAEELPATSLENAVAYEELIAGSDPARVAGRVSAATLCYTSGTTGNPKGVMQSHRSIVLQTWATCTGDGHDVNSSVDSARSTHVSCERLGTPLRCRYGRIKIILLGPDLSPEALIQHINTENVTFSAGVPTIWLSVVQHLKDTDTDVPSLKRLAVGGSAAIMLLMDTLRTTTEFVPHVWGMTEMTRISGEVHHRVQGLGREGATSTTATAGRELYGVELRLIDGDGHDVARDGALRLANFARGPWVAANYSL